MNDIRGLGKYLFMILNFIMVRVVLEEYIVKYSCFKYYLRYKKFS